MPEPLVSVLIVSFRCYPELDSCLSSLEAFVSDDIEVLVVDHEARHDQAVAIQSRFPWVRLFETDDNPGFAAGVNRAARSAGGIFFLFVNPDCVFREDVAHSLARYLDIHPAVGVCGPLVREVDGAIQPSARRFPGVSTGFAGRTSWLRRIWPANPWSQSILMTSRHPMEPLDVDWVSGACLMIRRTVFEAVAGMDERFFLYWEDADLCLRIRRRGWSVVYVPFVEVTHLTSRSSAQVPVRSLVAFHRSAFRYFVKHGGLFARTAAPLVYLGLQIRLALKVAALKLGRADNI